MYDPGPMQPVKTGGQLNDDLGDQGRVEARVVRRTKARRFPAGRYSMTS